MAERTPTERTRSARAALVCSAGSLLAALTGVFFPPGVYYAGLHQPAGTPPDIVFPVAWSLLYIAMTVAAWRVWRAAGVGVALGLFALQLALNALWMPTAFGAQALGWALAVIVALWLLLWVMLVAFWRADRVAAVLIVPYWAWVGYAVYLNAGLLWLN